MCRRSDKRWECLSSLSSPDEVTVAHLAKVYRLDKKACSSDTCRYMCKGNTRCLNHIVYMDEITNAVENDDESPDISRNILNLSGLRNYGSTCYLNAFLQIYFHFAELRQAIYQLPYNESSPEGVIEQLQLIFSQMQLSREGLVDPGGLIEALHLSERDQQDAPEFHSLFMSLLEGRFSSAGRTAIRDLFQGSCVYETRCQTCGFVSQRPSQFLELDIKVATGCLEEFLQKYLAEEELTGDNQYACPECGTKQDGSRRVRITATPLMLCIQLLRFNYDQRLGRRVKQAAPVHYGLSGRITSCPHPFALRCVCAEDECERSVSQTVKSSSDNQWEVPGLSASSNTVSAVEKKCRLYQCWGALMHLGRYSTSGHYIAVVRCSDGTSKYWKVCNDERVFIVPEWAFDLSKVNTTATSATSVRSIPKKAITTPNKSAPMCANSAEGALDGGGSGAVGSGNLYHTSSSAYMVFYRQVEADEISQNDVIPEVEVPAHLRRVVEASNVAFVAENMNKRLHKIEQKQIALRRQMLQRYILECLRTTRINEFIPRKRRKQSSSVSVNGDVEDSANVPTDINSDDLSGGSSDSTDSEFDDICIVPTRWLVDWLNSPHLPPPQLHFPPHDRGIFVDARESTPNQIIFCPHFRISPENPLFHIRAISRSGLSRCFNLSVNLETCEVISPNPTASPFTSPEAANALAPCIDCVRWRVAINGFTNECNVLAKKISRWRRVSKGGAWPLVPGAESLAFEGQSAPSSPPRVYLLGVKSFTNWRSYAQAYFSAAYLPSSSSPTMEFNKDAVCPHNRLSVSNIRCLPASLWQRLVTLFTPPNGTPSATVPEYPSDKCDFSTCHQCADAKDNLLARAQRERNAFSGILTALTSGSTQRRLDDLIADYRMQSDGGGGENQGIYLVPMEFMHHWRRFIRMPTVNPPPTSMPSGLEAAGVVCSHERLQMPWNELLEDELVYPLSSREWHQMSQFYPLVSDRPSLHLMVIQGVEKTAGEKMEALQQHHFVPVDAPDVCEECHTLVQQRRCNFVAGRIFIRQVAGPAEAMAFDNTTSAVLEETTESSKSPSKDAGDTYASVLRRSLRKRVSREDSILRVNSFTKLMDLRIQLINIVGAAPYDQHIVYNGEELTDNTSSLYQLGIRPETRLLIWVDTPNSEAIAEASKKPANAPATATDSSSSPVPGKSDRQVETGFKGTRLVEYWSHEDKNASLPGVS